MSSTPIHEGWRVWTIGELRFQLPKTLRPLKSMGTFRGRACPLNKNSVVRVSIVSEAVDASYIKGLLKDISIPPRSVDDDGSINKFHSRGLSIEFPRSFDVRLEVIPPVESTRRSSMRWNIYLKLSGGFHYVDMQCHSGGWPWKEFEAFGRLFLQSIEKV